MQRRQQNFPPPAARRHLAAAGLAALGALSTPALAADPVRGAQLFATAPRVGLLACADCHSDNPIVNNFGNIWSGRNAVSLIQRAVQGNTGGMGVFQGLYGATDLADIAAYLGNAPNAVVFPLTAIGATSPPQRITISSSLKLGLDGLMLATEGDFVIVGGSCSASLPRFASCTLDLAFRPSGQGTRLGALLIDHSGTPTPVRLPLSGQGPPRPRAVATLLPTRVDFAAGDGGGAGRRNVVLANDSAEPLRITSLSTSAAAEFVIAGGSCVAGLSLARGERCLMALRHDGNGAAAASGRLRIEHDGVGDQSTVELQAAAARTAPGRLAADREAIDFGPPAVGVRSAAQVVTLSNSGTAALAWRELAVVDPSFSIERTTCDVSRPLAPQQRCQVELAFLGARAGRVTSELRVLGSDGRALLRLPLAARAGDGAIVAASERLALQAEVAQRVLHELVLHNEAESPTLLPALTLSGPEAADFSIAGGSCRAGQPLPARASCSVGIAFAPRDVGPQLARLQAGEVGIELAGQAAAAGSAALWVDRSALDFGERMLGGGGAPLAVTLHNRGSAPLVWRALALAGSHAGDFTAAGDCRAEQPLLPAASCRAELRFAPAAAGMRTASLVAWPQGAAAPALVSLTGMGVPAAAPALVVDALTLDFGTLPAAADASTRRLRLRNAGSAAAAAPVLAIDGPFAIAALDSNCLAALAPGALCNVDIRFAANAAGAAGGMLHVQSAGSMPLAIVLRASRAESGAALAWTPVPGSPSHGATLVGQGSGGPAWTLVNRGNAATAPLRWTLDGAAGHEFSIDAGSSCSPGAVLAAGGSCALRVNFHPTAAGLREARLTLGEGASLDSVVLQGQAIAAARSALQAAPSALVFQARVDRPSAALPLRLSSVGAAGLALALPPLTNPVFASGADAGGPCGGEMPALLPGEACLFDISWTGAAGGLAGGAFVAAGPDALASASVLLSVSEDPAQRSNIGTGGGAGSTGWLIGLACAVAALRRVRTESAHACRPP